MVLIKGTTFLASREELIESHGQEGFEKARAMLSEADRDTLSHMILPTNRYPLDLYVRWLEVVVKVACDGDERRLVARSEHATAQTFKGVYQAFSKLKSMEAVVDRIDSITGTYFDGVTAEVKVEAPGRVTVIYMGFGKEHRIYEYIVLGWWREVLRTTGARNGRADIRRSLGTGGPLQIAVAWDPE